MPEGAQGGRSGRVLEADGAPGAGVGAGAGAGAGDELLAAGPSPPPPQAASVALNSKAKAKGSLQARGGTEGLGRSGGTNSHLVSGLRNAIRPGQGAMASRDERSVVRVLPDGNPPDANIFALFPSRRALSAAASQFLDFITMRLRALDGKAGQSPASSTRPVEARRR